MADLSHVADATRKIVRYAVIGIVALILLFVVFKILYYKYIVYICKIKYQETDSFTSLFLYNFYVREVIDYYENNKNK